MNSSSRVEVLWSPNEDNHFIVYDSTISCYQVHGLERVSSELQGNSLKVSDNKFALLCVTISDISFVKCVAWYPNSEHKFILAVGQTNGHIVLTNFGDPFNKKVIEEFVPKHDRQCNFLEWNPSDPRLLAEGLDRLRNDSCVVIWDVTVNHAVSEGTDRSRYGTTRHGQFLRPYAEIGAGESSSSFAWLDECTFVTGMNNRCLRIYNLNNSNKVCQTAQHSGVCGVCIDPSNTHMMSSYKENLVAIWDTRHFVRPVFTLQETEPVCKLGWCPTRSGMLTVLGRDSPSLLLYDIRRAISDSNRNDVNPVSVDRSIQPCGDCIVTSFAWHPKHENRLLAAASHAMVQDVIVQDRLPLGWSPDSKFIYIIGKNINTCQVEQSDDTLDISTRMRERALQGYGMLSNDIHANGVIVAGEPHLRSVWKWMSLVRHIPCRTKSAIKGDAPKRCDIGVKHLLNYYIEGGDGAAQSETVNVDWQTSNKVSSFSPRQQYRSQERCMALALCDWPAFGAESDLDAHLTELQKNGQVGKAVGLSIFFLKLDKAIELLTRTDSGEHGCLVNMNTIAMALAGYSEHMDDLWRKICSENRCQLPDPYLQAVFAFLASETSNYDAVLVAGIMSVEFRVGFALTYLPDDQLRQYICSLTTELVVKGDLDGIILTGLSTEGVDLLQTYIDMTHDVQTAALTAVLSCTTLCEDDERVKTWIYSYRNLLNNWELWYKRAEFDGVIKLCRPCLQDPLHVCINCSFCNKSISTSGSERGGRSQQLRNPFSTNRMAKQQRGKAACCPHCQKSLPRCALCCKEMGTASFYNPERDCISQGVAQSAAPQRDIQSRQIPLQNRFSFCRTCHHGGHAEHIMLWFKENTYCPVTGCWCKCASLDSLD